MIAVEPSGHNATAAEANCDLNGMTRITVVRAAISDQPGTLVFSEGLNAQLDDGSGAWGRVTVEAVTIDGLAERFGDPDVVFLDIEGAECLAMAGAARVLARGADFFVEVHVGCGLEKLGGSADRVLAFFPRDRFSLLARSEADATFREFNADDPLTRDRFFLLALLRAGVGGG